MLAVMSLVPGLESLVHVERGHAVKCRRTFVAKQQPPPIWLIRVKAAPRDVRWW